MTNAFDASLTGRNALAFAAAFLALFLSGCGYRYRISVDPAQASLSVDGGALARPAKPSGVFSFSSPKKNLAIAVAAEGYEPRELTAAGKAFPGTGEYSVTLPRIMRALTIELAQGVSEVVVDGESRGKSPVALSLAQGGHRVTLKRQGYPDQSSDILLDRPRLLRLRHQKDPGPWQAVGIVKVGRQPKSVSFTPDGRFLIVALLDDSGFDLIDLKGGYSVNRIRGPASKARGYVESLVCPEKGSFWLSQMTTGSVHEFSLPTEAAPTPVLLRSLSAHGDWTKVMAVDKDYRFLAAANWTSNDVAILDYASGALVAKLTGFSTPRGLVFTHDGAYLLVCSFNSGVMDKFDCASWKRVAKLVETDHALRHVVLSPDGATGYVSDLTVGKVIRFRTDTMARTAAWPTGPRANTIALSPDGGRLFVSCRGRDDPQTYLKRSPEDGEIYVIDTASGKTQTILQGGNQPTGLAVSEDGKTLAFSNFLDDEVELYRLSE